MAPRRENQVPDVEHPRSYTQMLAEEGEWGREEYERAVRNLRRQELDNQFLYPWLGTCCEHTTLPTYDELRHVKKNTKSAPDNNLGKANNNNPCTPIKKPNFDADPDSVPKRANNNLLFPPSKKPKIDAAPDSNPERANNNLEFLSSKKPTMDAVNNLPKRVGINAPLPPSKKPKHETNNNTVSDSHSSENRSRMSAKNIRRRRNRAKNRAAKNSAIILDGEQSNGVGGLREAQTEREHETV